MELSRELGLFAGNGWGICCPRGAVLENATGVEPLGKKFRKAAGGTVAISENFLFYDFRKFSLL